MAERRRGGRERTSNACRFAAERSARRSALATGAKGTMAPDTSRGTAREAEVSGRKGHAARNDASAAPAARALAASPPGLAISSFTPCAWKSPTRKHDLY